MSAYDKFLANDIIFFCLLGRLYSCRQTKADGIVQRLFCDVTHHIGYCIRQIDLIMHVCDESLAYGNKIR